MAEVDWSTVPVATEGAVAPPPVEDDGKSVLSPNYRPRDAFGGQELLGLVGGIGGGLAGSLAGPVGTVAGSIAGSGLGGAVGEGVEQAVRGESFSPSRIARAGLEEAVWDAAGNLVFKVAGKVFKFGAEQLGFTSKDMPDAVRAAQDFLQQYGSSLPKPVTSNRQFVLETAENLVTSPATVDIFRKKQAEISNALMTGNKEILNNLAKSPQFELALRQGTSPQRAAGEVLQSFIREGEQSLSQAVRPQYAEIFKDTNSRVSTFDIKQWAQRMLDDPASLTAGQRAIFKEMGTLPPQVSIELLHDIRSRWLAEARDKFSKTGTEKDSRASSTISELITKIDNSMDTAAKSNLDPKTLERYRTVTRTYREGIQGLQTEAVQAALAKNPEEVGGFLFAAGNETPVNQLFRSVAAAGKLSGKSSKEVLDALRYGYLQALTNTPDNLLKFATSLEKNQGMKNTFNILFDDSQKKAIQAMNDAAKLGLVEAKPTMGASYRGTSAIYGTGAAGLGLTYAFFLSPEQQQRVKDNLGSAAVSGGALILNQRLIAKMLLDPKGASTLSRLSTAKDKLTSPTAFTKLVLEPLTNFYGPGDTTAVDAAVQGSINWNTVPTK